ncbi:hypothetical protein [Sutcliffiella cohnii]|uniref:hypothetical protein n=1 Tax=Sutcliffiella cohnii TaxID=33932 RepID=UPI002E1E3664|nr:hypothetical protein [Sutcliffiella cohnii]
MGLLQALQLPAIPVLTLVVLTNSYTTLKSNPEYVKIPSNIVRAEALPMKLVDINRIHRKEIWSTCELKRVENLLKKRNVSFEPN